MWKPSLVIQTKLTNGTWIPDCVKHDVGPAAAIAWGEVFRFTKLEDGICRASIETMANLCGISPRSMADQLKKLENTGYIVDTTPDLFNKPHEYAITDKAGIEYVTAVWFEQQKEEKEIEMGAYINE